MGKVRVVNFQKNTTIYYSRNGNVLRLSTGIKWKDRLKYKDIVASYEQRVSNIVSSFTKENQLQPSVEYVKTKLAEREINKGSLFLDNFEDFIEQKEKEVREASLKDYISFKNSIIEYQILSNVKLTYDSITTSFIRDWCDFLLSDERPEKAKTKGNLNDKTISKRLVSLKAYLRWLELNNIYTFDKKVMSYKPISNYPTEIVALTLEELNSLKGLELSGNEEIVRDMFLFMSMTSLRYSDIITLDDADIDSKYRMEKTPKKAKNNATYSQTLNDTAIKIWDKYNHNFPKLTNQAFNRILKDICKDSELFDEVVTIKIKRNGEPVKLTFPKWDLISSHTARRTFITLHIERGTPINRIMKMTSHTQISTLVKYMDRFSNGNIEDTQKLNLN